MASDRLRALRLARAERRSSVLAKRNQTLERSLEDTTKLGVVLWLLYLYASYQIAMTTLSVTHADLFLDRPVKISALEVELPLKLYFLVTPVLFLVLHAYVLATLALIARKAARIYEDRTHADFDVFMLMATSPKDIPQDWFGRFSSLMVLITLSFRPIRQMLLVIFPITILVLLQIQFLPYHDSRVTWVHRLVLIADLVVIWSLWKKIVAAGQNRNAGGRAAPQRWARFWGSVRWLPRNVIAVPVTYLIVLFSVFVATFPGERRSWPYSFVPALESKMVATTQAIFGEIDPLNQDESKRIAGSWPANTLRLKGFDLYEALKIEDRAKIDWKLHSYALHHRHFDGVDLRSARLGKVDLRGAHLEGAWLDGAKLEGATLDGAELQGASLNRAQLQGASLNGVRLQGASLRGAQLQGASLESAQLQGASLNGANLMGASLFLGQLQSASFQRADLQGASLDVARLGGATFGGALLQGASLYGAQYESVDFSGALLWRTKWQWIPHSRFRAFGLRDAKWAPITGDDDEHFRPEPWSGDAYASLRRRIESVHDCSGCEAALKRIERLDCNNPDKTLAPCDRNAGLPRAVTEWKELLERMSVDDVAHESALAETFRETACSGDAEAIYFLRGIGTNGRLAAAGRQAPALIEHIMGPACAVSAALNEDDKARLLEVEKEAAETVAQREEQAKEAAAKNRPRAPSPAQSEKPRN